MNKLVVATLESKFRVYDLRTQHPEHGFAHLTERVSVGCGWRRAWRAFPTSAEVHQLALTSQRPPRPAPPPPTHEALRARWEGARAAKRTSSALRLPHTWHWQGYHRTALACAPRAPERCHRHRARTKSWRKPGDGGEERFLSAAGCLPWALHLRAPCCYTRAPLTSTTE